jgi:hypothetical protein
MARQYVRYVLCDANHHDVTIEDCGPLNAVGMLHRTLKQTLRMEGPYLKNNPQAFIAKVTYERVLKKQQKKVRG